MWFKRLSLLSHCLNRTWSVQYFEPKFAALGLNEHVSSRQTHEPPSNPQRIQNVIGNNALMFLTRQCAIVFFRHLFNNNVFLGSEKHAAQHALQQRLVVFRRKGMFALKFVFPMLTRRIWCNGSLRVTYITHLSFDFNNSACKTTPNPSALSVQAWCLFPSKWWKLLCILVVLQHEDVTWMAQTNHVIWAH